jgi:hypothetical protein
MGNCDGVLDSVNARIICTDIQMYINELNSIENKNTRALNFRSTISRIELPDDTPNHRQRNI